MKVLKIEQMTDAWRQWRNNGLGGSDACVIMKVSPYKTPFELWQEKKGIKEPFKGNWATKRGQEVEPKIRKEFERRTDVYMNPMCVQHDNIDFLRCSLDGINMDQDQILEIKYAGKDPHSKAKNGNVPEKYRPQIQHNLLVTGADYCWYCSYNESDSDLQILTVQADPEYQEKLLEKEKEFWRKIKNDEEPEKIPGRDVVEKNDKEWKKAVKKFKKAKKKKKEAKEEYDKAKDRLEELADGKTCKGAGVKATLVNRKGRISYKSLMNDLDIDDETKEEYRGSGYSYYRIQEIKED